jgi:hypothetical protein
MTSRMIRGFSGALLLVVLGVAGCSSGDEGGADAFVGMWQYTSGTQNTQCPMINVNTLDQLAGQKEVFSRGVGSALVNSDPGSSCILNFNISGNTATANAGQTCMTNVATDQGSIPTTITLVSAVFSVNGTTAHYSHSANFVLNVGGQSIQCSETGSGDLLRISM